MRGCPGSGKSTAAKRLRERLEDEGKSVVVCSSDDFFVCPSCSCYNFSLAKLRFAHAWCREKFEKALKDGVENVIVDNTNVSVQECRPYVQLALQYGYEVEFLEPTTPWAFDLDQLSVKNTHSVPREALERMLGRWVPDMTVEKALGESRPGPMHEDEKAAFAAGVGRD